ncbi:MAG: transcription elongation factor GreA, partial [Candidatus Saccharibacteria bacterium]|nr:transcription elongation factor GreA [Candidatus Saccharibacteria bacterium]
MKKIVNLTQAGKTELERELQELIAERPAIAERIAIARDFGDLKENEEYAAARAEQRQAENRILELEEIIKNAKII